MKIIIAGGRNISKEIVFQKLEYCFSNCNITITEEVCGGAKGVDAYGKEYAETIMGIPTTIFDAKWKDLKAPGAVVKTNQYGSYNANAGFDRNEKMAQYADGLILIWDGKSSGSNDMKNIATTYKLMVIEYIV